MMAGGRRSRRENDARGAELPIMSWALFVQLVALAVVAAILVGAIGSVLIDKWHEGRRRQAPEGGER